METIINASARSLQHYVIAKRWKSDIEFFKVETSFLHRLLNLYFMRLANPAHIEQLTHAGKKLLQLEDDKFETDTLLKEQLHYLELLAEDKLDEDPDEIDARQIRLESMVANLSHEYRDVKLELFKLVESAMQQSKLLSEL